MRSTVRIASDNVIKRKITRVPTNNQEALALFRRASSVLKDEEEEYGKEKKKELSKGAKGTQKINILFLAGIPEIFCYIYLSFVCLIFLR